MKAGELDSESSSLRPGGGQGRNKVSDAWDLGGDGIMLGAQLPGRVRGREKPQGEARDPARREERNRLGEVRAGRTRKQDVRRDPNPCSAEPHDRVEQQRVARLPSAQAIVNLGAVALHVETHFGDARPDESGAIVRVGEPHPVRLHRDVRVPELPRDPDEGQQVLAKCRLAAAEPEAVDPARAARPQERHRFVAREPFTRVVARVTAEAAEIAAVVEGDLEPAPSGKDDRQVHC